MCDPASSGIISDSHSLASLTRSRAPWLPLLSGQAARPRTGVCSRAAGPSFRHTSTQVASARPVARKLVWTFTESAASLNSKFGAWARADQLAGRRKGIRVFGWAPTVTQGRPRRDSEAAGVSESRLDRTRDSLPGWAAGCRARPCLNFKTLSFQGQPAWPCHQPGPGLNQVECFNLASLITVSRTRTELLLS